METPYAQLKIIRLYYSQVMKTINRQPTKKKHTGSSVVIGIAFPSEDMKVLKDMVLFLLS